MCDKSEIIGSHCLLRQKIFCFSITEFYEEEQVESENGELVNSDFERIPFHQKKKKYGVSPANPDCVPESRIM